MGQKQNMQNNSLMNSNINPILVIIACSALAYFILF